MILSVRCPVNRIVSSDIYITSSRFHQVRRQFTLVHLECPPGFKLSSDSDSVCECEDRVEVLTCDPDMEFVLLDVSHSLPSSECLCPSVCVCIRVHAMCMCACVVIGFGLLIIDIKISVNS